MSVLTKATVLVLNRNWQAINPDSSGPQEAFCMMATNVATGLEILKQPGLVGQGSEPEEGRPPAARSRPEAALGSARTEGDAGIGTHP
jgi:hypothetical protein